MAVNPTRWILAGISLAGVAAFLAPFVLAAARDAGLETSAHAADAPYLFALVTGVCLVSSLLAVADDQTGAGQAKTIALLGVLVAVDASLRLVPGVLGASPIFPLIILVGVVFGASFGFQMGAITILLSAFLTGGVGPWLPFQMFTAGWVGMTAGWLPQPRSHRLRIGLIVAFGSLWGLGFGVIMNLWFWPLAAPGAGTDNSLYWNPELGLAETVGRYARFYVSTSLLFDLTRAIGNAVLLALLASPILRLLERYRNRFTWEPWTEFTPSAPRRALPDAFEQ